MISWYQYIRGLASNRAGADDALAVLEDQDSSINIDIWLAAREARELLKP